VLKPTLLLCDYPPKSLVSSRERHYFVFFANNVTISANGTLRS
jgi:hypothetical protein